jgi:hypothetical protein
VEFGLHLTDAFGFRQRAFQETKTVTGPGVLCMGRTAQPTLAVDEEGMSFCGRARLSLNNVSSASSVFVGKNSNEYGRLGPRVKCRDSEDPGNLTFPQLAFGYVIRRVLIAWLLLPQYLRGECSASALPRGEPLPKSCQDGWWPDGPDAVPSKINISGSVLLLIPECSQTERTFWPSA